MAVSLSNHVDIYILRAAFLGIKGWEEVMSIWMIWKLPVRASWNLHFNSIFFIGWEAHVWSLATIHLAPPKNVPGINGSQSVWRWFGKKGQNLDKLQVLVISSAASVTFSPKKLACWGKKPTGRWLSQLATKIQLWKCLWVVLRRLWVQLT